MDKTSELKWYDQFYTDESVEITNWYKYLLPELIHNINPSDRIIELGCGISPALTYIYDNKILKASNIYGIDQSEVAIQRLKSKLPKVPLNNLQTGDISNLSSIKRSNFDHVLMMEVIEHVEDAVHVIKELKTILKTGGLFYLSFPNYNNIPWLILRILAEQCKNPSWINLQPVDKIYFYRDIINIFKQNGFQNIKSVGTTYFPPLLYKYETDEITKTFNKINLTSLSFHPVIVFKYG